MPGTWRWAGHTATAVDIKKGPRGPVLRRLRFGQLSQRYVVVRCDFFERERVLVNEIEDVFGKLFVIVGQGCSSHKRPERLLQL